MSTKSARSCPISSYLDRLSLSLHFSSSRSLLRLLILSHPTYLIVIINLHIPRTDILLQAEGVNHNIVAICRLNGLPAQKSFDRINDILKTCYRDWYLALADLPQWGEEIDQQVQKYAQGLECVIRANLNWRWVLFTYRSTCIAVSSVFCPRDCINELTASYSFKSQRYLGKEHSKIRKTRLIHVLPRPADIV